MHRSRPGAAARPALALLVTILLSAAGACLPVTGSLLPAPALTLYQPGSHMHAFQTGSFAYSFMHGHEAQWLATLDKVEGDALPLLAALRDAGHSAAIVMRPERASDGTEFYNVDLAITTKGGGKGAGKTLVVEGTTGMTPEKHAALAASAAEATGQSADVIARGHFALYGLVNMLTAINVSGDTLQRHAFALLVLKEKVAAGEKADWFDANRPPAETAEDADLALKIIADHHATAAAWRAEILGMVAMAGNHAVPGVLDELRAQIGDSRARAKAWEASHHQPTMDDFGVAVASLPDPQKMLDDLEAKLGFVSAVAQVARGVVTGSPSATLDGLAKLAPADTNLKTALEGAAAATKGDIPGTLDAVAKLAGKEAELDAVKSTITEVRGRLDRVQKAVAAVRGKSPGAVL
jgi:hypothetical protein